MPGIVYSSLLAAILVVVVADSAENMDPSAIRQPAVLAGNTNVDCFAPADRAARSYSGDDVRLAVPVADSRKSLLVESV